MPSIEQNLIAWDATFEWAQRGDEWSYNWGTSDAEWYGSILPRIHQWLPTGTMLELAPGFGRWTQYLKGYADKLILVDVSPRCIEGCRERFKGESHHLPYERRSFAPDDC